MKRLIFEERYERGYLLDESLSFDKPPIFKRDKGWMDCDSMAEAVKEFSRFAQIDTDIYETETELIFRFYFSEHFALNDLGLPLFERILARCESLSLKKSDEPLLAGILELKYIK